MDSVKMREAVEAGKTILGIEFGSTRIKAVLPALRMHPAIRPRYPQEYTSRFRSPDDFPSHVLPVQLGHSPHLSALP